MVLRLKLLETIDLVTYTNDDNGHYFCWNSPNKLRMIEYCIKMEIKRNIKRHTLISKFLRMGTLAYKRYNMFK
jgi:hypothetical protein